MSDQRLANFLENWIDANIAHPAQPGADVAELERRFLTDAVASGITLEEVNECWDHASASIKSAVSRTDSLQLDRDKVVSVGG